ncbi:MAG: HIT domain-containing protein [Candidatus Aenigmarchaeota archaeon]|nr:HIT domain-containing protein [Candidatus Aenigmarchaeota archaeon]
MDEKCIFCAIVAKKIPSLKVYEDDKFIAFLDIRPLTEGHVQVVSKNHYRWTYDVPEFGNYWEVARKIAFAQMNSLNAKYVQFLTAGMGVHHAHIHVVPRYDDDGHGEYLDPNKVKQISEPRYKEIMQTLKSSLSDSSYEQPAVVEHVKERKPRKPRSDIGSRRTRRKRTKDTDSWLKRELAQT